MTCTPSSSTLAHSACWPRTASTTRPKAMRAWQRPSLTACSATSLSGAAVRFRCLRLGRRLRRRIDRTRRAGTPPCRLHIGLWPCQTSSRPWMRQSGSAAGRRSTRLWCNRWVICRHALGPRARTVSYERRRGYTIERVSLDDGVDGEISALVLVPERLSRPAPAMLWLHSSTPDKAHVLIPHTSGGAEPLGEAFVRRGWVVLASDAYWHGDRAGTGPAGPLETGRAEQESLFKLHLWFGRTLWGMCVRDDQIALDYLCSRPEVDAGRIGATGMSMGSTRAWWLAALDERIRVAQALRQRGRALADRTEAVARTDRRLGRRLSCPRRPCAGKAGRRGLRWELLSASEACSTRRSGIPTPQRWARRCWHGLSSDSGRPGGCASPIIPAERRAC